LVPSIAASFLIRANFRERTQPVAVSGNIGAKPSLPWGHAKIVSHQRSISMKLSPTVTLALAFAAGMAGVAAAQNSATSGTTPSSPQTTAPMSAG